MPPLPHVVVEHATEKPSEDCAVASALAARLADCGEQTVSLVRLRDPNAAFPRPGSAEHVLAEGRLADNSLFWVERALSSGLRFVEAPDLPDPGTGHLVVAFNSILAPRVNGQNVGRRLETTGRQLLWLRAAGDGDGLSVRVVSQAGPGPEVARAARDRYGRWSLRDRGLSALWAERFGLPAPTAPAGPPNRDARPGGRVAVVGEVTHLRDVFPAVLAALGDAAEAADRQFEIEIVSPKGLDRAGWVSRLAAADGLVLPGGSDLGQVEGQVQAASVVMTGGLPTIGLCLGMQSMAIAVARTAAGLPEANLEEADPEGPCHLFQRLKGERDGSPHRLGKARIRIVPGTRLADCCREETRLERLNHRYALAEGYVPRLEAAGLRICARSDDGSIVDGIELSDHPLFIGLQSHPELSSRAAAPHPLFRRFLRAVGAHRQGAAQS